eukprot:5045368-Pleurochrysis_carterae.AAC.3
MSLGRRATDEAAGPDRRHVRSAATRLCSGRAAHCARCVARCGPGGCCGGGSAGGSSGGRRHCSGRAANAGAVWSRVRLCVRCHVLQRAGLLQTVDDTLGCSLLQSGALRDEPLPRAKE